MEKTAKEHTLYNYVHFGCRCEKCKYLKYLQNQKIRHKQQQKHDYSWMDNANCNDMDTDFFFSESSYKQKVAVKICYGCVVKNDCLKYALRKNCKYGIFAGMDPNERKCYSSTCSII
ncbi:MAG: WhiB family transcriptional regulator [Candidatus Ancillula sp.]|nr:WhiB family transcriptional regulator [Candidatus Ancillula sp.]